MMFWIEVVAVLFVLACGLVMIVDVGLHYLFRLSDWAFRRRTRDLSRLDRISLEALARMDRRHS